MLKKSLILASCTLSLSVFGTNPDKAIYGQDNRKDIYEVTNPSFLEMSKATAAMMKISHLRVSLFTTNFKIRAETLRQYGACSTERFASQPTAADCTGFLVSPTKLVTAGHCIKSSSDCANIRWVFDYKTSSASQTQYTVSPSKVYKCTKVLARSLDSGNKNDYAVVELERPVTDRLPLKVRSAGKVSVGDELVVIGHPTGLPTKVADGAKVRSVGEVFFVANLDTYGGNSGSPVINVKTEEVEGILVRGERDYVAQGGCLVSKKCKDDECRGEDVTHITNVPGL